MTGNSARAPVSGCSVEEPDGIIALVVEDEEANEQAHKVTHANMGSSNVTYWLCS